MMLGFKDRFEPMIVDGTKRHTIRNGTRWVDLYVRPRQRDMRLLFRAQVTGVEDITIADGNGYLIIHINGSRLHIEEARALLYRDGFRDPGSSSMAQAALFWRENLTAGVFRGQVIHWDYDGRSTAIGK